MQSRYSLIEALRALGAISLVSYHFLLFSGEQGTLFAGLHQEQFGLRILVTALFIFFFLSAIVIPLHQWENDYRLKDFGRFFFKRLTRLYIPFVVILLLTITVEWLFALRNDQPLPIDTRKLAGNFTLTAEFLRVPWYNSIFWTLAIEIQFYLFMGLVFGLFKRFGLRFIIVFLVAGELTHVFFPDSRLLHFYTPYFAAGFLTFLFLKGKTSLSLFVAGCILIAILTYFFHNPYAAWIMFPFPLLFLLKRGPVWLERIGHYSFSVYLVHGLTGGQLLYFTRHWGNSILFSSGRLILAFLVTAACSWVFYKLVEKPAAQFTRRIRYRRS